MPYVSVKFTMDPTTGETNMIEATDDQGLVWFIPSVDCDIGNWVEYRAAGGTISPYQPPVAYEPYKPDPAYDVYPEGEEPAEQPPDLPVLEAEHNVLQDAPPEE